MKVWTVEWHGAHDGGHVEAIFDSQDKAQALLWRIQKEGKFADDLFDRFCTRMHKIKYAMGYKDGEQVPYEHKWNRVWHRGCDLVEKCPYRYTYEDYSVAEYEVQ